jgi:hypothetical protein
VPQLEILVIEFHSPLERWHIGWHVWDTPIMPHIPITLPNLHRFSFKGDISYLKGFVGHISTPALSTLQIKLFNWHFGPAPPLSQFIGTSPILGFRSLCLDFYNQYVIITALQFRQRRRSFSIRVKERPLCRQVCHAIAILDTLQPVLSAVVKLTLEHPDEYQSSAWVSAVGRTFWRDLFRPFTNLKTLRVDDGLVDKFAPSLQTEDGESPLELLPNLKVVEYSGEDHDWALLTPFLDE